MLDRNLRNWKKTLKFTLASAAFGIAAGVGAFAFSNEMAAKPEAAAAVTGTAAVADAMASIGVTNLNGASGNVIDVSNIVDAALPSVVAVNCITYSRQGNGMNLFGMGMYGNGDSGRVVEEASCGTGIIIGESGESLMILTNNHVIEDADKVSVAFMDETAAEGTVLGSDADADLAVILIPLASMTEQTKSSIRVAALGDSDEVKVGEAAIAIGNALGYGQSVTTGVISALNREINLTDKTMTLLQTDAAINGGNSGGPLLNAKGEVIGINTVKYAASGVEGMGYAIPITSAKPIIEAIINSSEEEEQSQGGVLLGIYGIDVTEQYQRVYQMPAGIYVYQVVEGSPAQIYQIPTGSIITGIDENRVESMEQLSALLKSYQPGDTVTVSYLTAAGTGYKENQIQAVLAEKQE